MLRGSSPPARGGRVLIKGISRNAGTLSFRVVGGRPGVVPAPGDEGIAGGSVSAGQGAGGRCGVLDCAPPVYFPRREKAKTRLFLQDVPGQTGLRHYNL